MKLIYIEWEDAVTNAGWFSEEEIGEWRKDAHSWVIHETGFLIEENKRFILLAGGFKPADDWVDIKYVNLHKIPKTWIRKRIDLTSKIKDSK